MENVSRSNCPVCLEDIHTSRIPCHIPDCGHLLHRTCFEDLLQSGLYTCPSCQTCLIDMTPVTGIPLICFMFCWLIFIGVFKQNVGVSLHLGTIVQAYKTKNMVLDHAHSFMTTSYEVKIFFFFIKVFKTN